ncbi:hypothetical protein HK097_007720 [Rhizophlyctis rosea]|uniref:Transcription factor TFIIIC triple barrel domain-containing protein n=1 Tax=Rhizophlyctis rosea TaxID=64517 RepID=A0AAD5X4J3_9FUNG|nr:hypothetical protein HK097_007720 [Rhizophlyctis rosea]
MPATRGSRAKARVTESEDEYEEEVTYIVMDIGTELTQEMVNNAATKNEGISITGIETGNPFLRIGSLFYQGQFDQCLGTDLIFSSATHDESKPKRAPQGPLPFSTDPSRPEIEMKLVGHSTKKLKMSRVVLEPKVDLLRPANAGPSHSNNAAGQQAPVADTEMETAGAEA